MENKKSIAVMIHDLNPWGGQDRSMLEIAWRLNKQFPLEIHSFSLEGYDNWPDMQAIPYSAPIKKPIILKYLNYHFNSWRNLKKSSTNWVQSTGTASMVSDVVQVQFIHHTWQEIAEKLPADKSSNPFFFIEMYRSALDAYKKLLEKNIYKPEKKYVAISHSIKKELMRHFNIPEKNIVTIHHGVDDKHFHPIATEEAKKDREQQRDKLGINNNDFVLLHVGALNARKGLFQSFRTIAHFQKMGFDNIKLLAVGQGDQKVLKKLSSELDIEDKIILAPHTKDIRKYYWAADCFFFPTFYEPFGLVILEAMACGLPVVTSQLAGGAELIDHEVSGRLFNPFAAIDVIANEILPLIKDPKMCEEIAINGRKVAEKRNWDIVGQEYCDFYQKLSKDSQF